MDAALRRTLACAAAVAFSVAASPVAPHARARPRSARGAYLGFDSNNYPGDAAMPVLRRTFSYAGYWLNRPPGGASIPWSGKRALLLRTGFGFLVLFNGRLERNLRNTKRAAQLGSSDAVLAVNAAIREGFHPGTIIFLDQEEGGEMEPDQMAYVLAWIDGVRAAHFRAGIYCSGMPASAGVDGMVITADDIRRRAGSRDITFFVYNDACPPSPGCASSNRPPALFESGVPFASVWQFAQSPRRRQYTAACISPYNSDGNCYPPGFTQSSALIDLDSATSPDPSAARR
jgi:Rv2525c-like, glycoside hydrolase-like domain